MAQDRPLHEQTDQHHDHERKESRDHDVEVHREDPERDDVAREHHELALREVDDLRRLVDEHESEGHDRIEGSDEKPVQHEFDVVHRCSPLVHPPAARRRAAGTPSATCGPGDAPVQSAAARISSPGPCAIHVHHPEIGVDGPRGAVLVGDGDVGLHPVAVAVEGVDERPVPFGDDSAPDLPRAGDLPVVRIELLVEDEETLDPGPREGAVRRKVSG